MLLLIHSWPSALPTETLNTKTLVLGAMVSLDWLASGGFGFKRVIFQDSVILDAFKSRWTISNAYLIK